MRSLLLASAIYVVLLIHGDGFLAVRRGSSNGHTFKGTSFPDLERCLLREYTSFFNPFETKFYDSNIKFKDPLTSLVGVDDYKRNIETIGGKSILGSLLFDDASIVLHNTVQLGPNRLQTRWTLQVTAKVLPWKPRAKFTGVSVYDINVEGKIVEQADYWDSINLLNGKYLPTSFTAALQDFMGQLQQENGAEQAAPELPYELLRRGKRYDVRRYPSAIFAETVYDQRPVGYDRLASYTGGSNTQDKKVSYFSPTIMKVRDGMDRADLQGKGSRIKVMSWPLKYALPGQALPDLGTFPASTIPSVALSASSTMVVAVARFDVAATEPVARGYTAQLISDVQRDELIPDAAANAGEIIVAQYDALFSVNKRRNEVWVGLAAHPWMP